jgi:hypothetical protein
VLQLKITKHQAASGRGAWYAANPSPSTYESHRRISHTVFPRATVQYSAALEVLQRLICNPGHINGPAKAELYIIAWAPLGPCAAYRSNPAAASSIPLTRAKLQPPAPLSTPTLFGRLNPYHPLHNVHAHHPLCFFFVQQAKHTQPASNLDCP